MFEGMLTALVTPFRDDEVDEAALRELVERQIGIERANHPVAILPGPFTVLVLFGLPLRVGIAGNVQPVAGPMLTVMRRIKQVINQVR